MMNSRKEKNMQEAYATLADVIRSYEPDRMTRETISSLRFMLKHETFAPIRDVIVNKLIDIGEYFRNRDERIVRTNLEGKPINKPKRTPDNRKKKRKVANAADAPEGSTPGPSMEFEVRGGILVPRK
jgi:hypothetical protein